METIYLASPGASLDAGIGGKPHIKTRTRHLEKTLDPRQGWRCWSKLPRGWVSSAAFSMGQFFSNVAGIPLNFVASLSHWTSWLNHDKPWNLRVACFQYAFRSFSTIFEAPFEISAFFYRGSNASRWGEELTGCYAYQEPPAESASNFRLAFEKTPRPLFVKHGFIYKSSLCSER